MRIVCDTNVLISGILFAGKPRRILRLAAQGQLDIYGSTAILVEAEAVLILPKFGLSANRVAAILGLFQDTFRHVVPTERFRVVEADPDDDAVIEAAGAEFIVSGGRHLLQIGEWRGIEILTPAGLLVRLEDPGL